ncbi:hypothetical protein TWF694_010364 [Orbilia ellipsospora]|uniref:Aminotransferase class I/classII large domain-containing protein n=1 Tax=Orbilia ellipsospora TaxID=2528407 RepID=A0AAV9XA42_9PEZI
MSKDFCSNGLRLGVLVSRNKAVIEAISSVNQTGWPSALADQGWSIILEDSRFLNYYLKEHQKRLADQYRFVGNLLDELGLVYTQGGNAGFCLWLDLRFALGRPKDGGKPGIEENKKLHRKIIEGGVRLAGDYPAEQYGWYRITFTQPRPLLLIGLEKLMKALTAIDTGSSARIFSTHRRLLLNKT